MEVSSTTAKTGSTNSFCCCCNRGGRGSFPRCCKLIWCYFLSSSFPELLQVFLERPRGLERARAIPLETAWQEMFRNPKVSTSRHFQA